MTAYAMKEDRERCMAAGMNGYIAKPIGAAELIGLVQRLGAKHRGQRRDKARGQLSSPGVGAGAAQPPVDAHAGMGGQLPSRRKLKAPDDDQHPAVAREAPDASAANVFNLGEGVARCFRKYDLFQDMVECLYEESDALLDQMRKALEGRDSEELGRAAHRLKGTVVFLGAPRAAEAARRVEQIGLQGELDTCGEALDQLQEQISLLQAALVPHRKNAK